ncbi:GNAT family N-acetyltransferase [Vibrio salinus]|uniref:GNAT family N-acetyltransferase n=1 Tax=Vibrio salinus TaxID=2899784 RepID=UPI001E57FC06|nr:GNAT family N-acetyltransferase [Vibrio salinus]MCE0494953.1 GNAT family N-acetyltransferase [Vibrio salinus]
MDVTMPIENVVVRPMTSSDLMNALSMTQALHWPHTYQDWDQIVSLGPSLVMEIDGDMIGTACLVPQGDYASVGLIVISDQYQGHGLGRRIMHDIMDCAATDSYFYLTATEMGKPLYKKLGFVEYNVIEQYQNTVSSKDITLVQPIANADIRTYQTKDYDRLHSLINAATGMDRKAILDLMLRVSSHTLVVSDDGEITGFAMYRPFGRGFSIGPVIADCTQNALALISSLLKNADGEFVRLDIINQYPETGKMLTEWGLAKVDTVSQMVKGKVPEVNGHFKQFGLVTQAIG